MKRHEREAGRDGLLLTGDLRHNSVVFQRTRNSDEFSGRNRGPCRARRRPRLAFHRKPRKADAANGASRMLAQRKKGLS